MIPFIRCLAELRAITNQRHRKSIGKNNHEFNSLTEDSGQRKRYIGYVIENKVCLPNLPKGKRRKWTRGKEAVSKFFNELDYNNQIQSSYDLTLLENQNYYDQKDVA